MPCDGYWSVTETQKWEQIAGQPRIIKALSDSPCQMCIYGESCRRMCVSFPCHNCHKPSGPNSINLFFFQYWELKGQVQGIGRVGSIQGERFSSSNTTLDTCLSPEAPLLLRTPSILYRDLLLLLLCFTWHFHCPKHKYSHILNYWLLRLCDLEEYPESVN